MNATFMLRLKAFLFDYVLILVYIIVVFVVSVLIFPSLQNLFQGSLVVAQLTGFLLITFPVSLYFIICDSVLVGQSFGKKKMGIQVVNQNGKPLSISHSTIRLLVKFLPWELTHFLVYRLVHIGEEGTPLYLVILGGVIYVLIFAYILTTIFTKNKQSLYDLVCRTQVMKVNENITMQKSFMYNSNIKNIRCGKDRKMNGRYSEIDEVIVYIHRHLHEPLTLSRLACYVSYSPFHFSRIFKERTGLSPLYYVSALRLHKAKDLLLNTELTVRDIGLEIGQQSLGTFTSQFTKRVGVTPSQFRESSRQVHEHLQSLQQLGHWSDFSHRLNPNMSVKGTVRAEAPLKGFILIGLFSKPIPEGMPLYGTLLSSLGDFCFSGVQPGRYYLMATSVFWGMETTDILLPNTTLRARNKTPIIVQPFTSVPQQKLTLHPPQLDDPPILISLPVLINHFLQRVFQNSNR